MIIAEIDSSYDISRLQFNFVPNLPSSSAFLMAPQLRPGIKLGRSICRFVDFLSFDWLLLAT
jgi:hypothetical protein